jgi:hypothetical protein
MDTKKHTLFLLLLCVCITLSAQPVPDKAKAYPTAYFRNPLNIPIVLAGNFGECRPGHFHSGLDIKTEGKENQPVFAAADGYVSRIKIEKGGFGHALYITHPNGYTTLYAHLNDFIPEIQKLVHIEQYAKEDFRIDIKPEPSKFQVKKGQQIAWSGNTGGSTAPHLHFEIRNTATEHPLNPQLFGFDVKDHIAPKPLQLAVYDFDMGQGIYEQTPHFFNLQKNALEYHTVPDTIEVNSEQVGIGVVVNDYMEGSDNTLAFYKASTFLSNAQTITMKLDDIGYDQTRYVNAYFDYKTKQLFNKTVQCLFQLDGNPLDDIYYYTTEYRKLTQRGKFEIPAGQTKLARIELSDAAGNLSTISFYIHHKPVWDKKTKPCENKFFFHRSNSFSNDQVAFLIPEHSLYEHICFTYSSQQEASSYSDHHTIGAAYIPVHNYFDLYIKATKNIPDKIKDKIAMVYSDGKDQTGIAAENSEGWYKASVRNFGEYWLVADETAPIIKPLQKENASFEKGGILSFSIKDEVTSVKKIRAELDGKWICFEQKGDDFSYKIDENCPLGKHSLKLTATDENNNTRPFEFSFVSK